MNRKIAHIVGTLWLGLLLFFGALPKDIIHQFAGHEDTRHAAHFGHEGPVIEQQHHHCDYIDFAITPFAHQAFSFDPVFHEPLYFSYFDAPVNGHLSSQAFHTALRGPPVA